MSCQTLPSIDSNAISLPHPPTLLLSMYALRISVPYTYRSSLAGNNPSPRGTNHSGILLTWLQIDVVASHGLRCQLNHARLHIQTRGDPLLISNSFTSLLLLLTNLIRHQTPHVRYRSVGQYAIYSTSIVRMYDIMIDYDVTANTLLIKRL